MGFLQTLLGLLRETRLVAALLLCGALAVLSVVFYFIVVRPRRGTTEWMQRLNRQKPTYFPFPRLHGPDSLWLIVSMILSALLRFVYVFLWLRLHLRPAPLDILYDGLNFVLLRMGLAAALAAGIYLLLRCIFASELPVVCIASLSGLFISDASDTLILLVFSLLCLYLWMCIDERRPLLPGALWLPVSGILYAWACLTCLQCLLLLPFYLLCYVGKQMLRFYAGDPLCRLRKLIFSLIITLLCVVLGAILLFVFYVLLSNRYAGDPLDNLLAPAFYRNMLPLAAEKLSQLFVRQNSFRASILAKDSLLFVFGLLSAIPLFHGLIVRKEMRCAWILTLAACFTLPWFVCGVYLMNLPMLLLLAYSWDTHRQRGRGYLSLVYALVLAASYTLLLI